ncbi:MAG: hypothetical protein V4665_01700 [Patescibacteria group bacterium]
MEDITFDTIEWQAPEYSHKTRSADWYWTIGLAAIAGCIVALVFGSYVFAIFIFISGGCLILFTLREPEQFQFAIETEGLRIGKDLYSWKNIKGFTIKNKKGDAYAKLIVQTHKYFLPVYTILLPKELVPETRETLLRVVPPVDLEESRSMVFMEKLGF